LRARVLSAPEVSSDGWNCYPGAIEDAFGIDVTYGQIEKYYGLQAGIVDAAPRYSLAGSSGKQAPASRAPVPFLCRAAKPYASDAATPLHPFTNAFSKKLENHEAAVALYVAHDNHCRVHETPRSRQPCIQADGGRVANGRHR
jgi:hypothetical protein